jgi:hypothetical protein
MSSVKRIKIGKGDSAAVKKSRKAGSPSSFSSSPALETPNETKTGDIVGNVETTKTFKDLVSTSISLSY